MPWTMHLIWHVDVVFNITYSNETRWEKNYQKWSIPTQQWCEWVKNLWFHSNLVNECLVACMVRLRSLDWLASLNSHWVCKRRRKQYSHILIRSRLNLPKQSDMKRKFISISVSHSFFLLNHASRHRRAQFIPFEWNW